MTSISLCFDISIKKAKIESENLVSERGIIEADRNVVLIWAEIKPKMWYELCPLLTLISAVAIKINGFGINNF